MTIEPLIEALANGTAVAFVGAGASAASGFPLWRDFLRELFEHAKSISEQHPGREADEWARTQEFLKDDFLLAAEMLQRELPVPTFAKFIQDRLGRTCEPNDIHRSIARLPFSLALTVNFDRLLEASYPNHPCFTWKHHDAIFSAIRMSQFAVVKLHGSTDDVESIRLTRTQYRASTFETPEFNECLKTLLTWRTFLFIGYSLRDSDLLHLIDSTRLRFGQRFGPHYAIMPEHEVDSKFERYLKEALGIVVIPYPGTRDEATSNVVGILKKLSGEVAKKRHRTQGFDLSDPQVSRADAAQRLLNYAAKLTGSVRGDVCLIERDSRPELNRIAKYPEKSKDLPPIDPDSVISSVFLQANTDATKDYMYLPDVSKAAEELQRLSFLAAKYVVCDTDVRSELACPIIADGRRVGVLNLEATLADAYTVDHIQVAQRLAAELGQIHLQAEQRRREEARLEEFYTDPARFNELLQKSLLVSFMGHDFILYEIDYEKKALIAHHEGDTEAPLVYGFSEKSLLTKVFMNPGIEELSVEDADEELKITPIEDRPSWLNERGTKRYNIKGPVYACRVRVAGHTVAVLVTWLKEAMDLAKRGSRGQMLAEFRASCRQAQRLAGVIANDFYDKDGSRAERMLDRLYEGLRLADHSDIWRLDHLADPVFREGVIGALMLGVIGPATGLRRVRVWRTDEIDEDSKLPKNFVCVDSLTQKGAATKPGNQERGAYKSNVSKGGDIYSRHTISRYRNDPYAKWQHPKMLGGVADVNSERLDKDPAGSWIVAPVVRHDWLLGFISADSHEWIDGSAKERSAKDQREIALQCRFLDVISDLAQYVLLRKWFEK